MRRGLLVLAIAGAMAGAAARSAEPPRAHVEGGEVVGVESRSAKIFRAIPYAAPPIGPLRWRPPAPAPPWSGARAATAPGAACPQKVSPGVPNLGGYIGPVSEDCLTLDVTAPKEARRAPVMVWVYGGGNVAGATNLPSCDAAGFARDRVVLVAMNYRLGPLGFFAHPALTAEAAKSQPLVSYGLMDQIAALKWVKRNIAAFGGDPANVTLFGESAGGEDVLQLMATPTARGLFNKAIVQSGGGWNPLPDLKTAEAAGVELASKVGLPGAAATAAQLRALPAEALVAAGGRAGPVVDGRLIRESATVAFVRGDEAAVPLIIGSNSNEASLMRAFGLDPKISRCPRLRPRTFAPPTAPKRPATRPWREADVQRQGDGGARPVDRGQGVGEGARLALLLLLCARSGSASRGRVLITPRKSPSSSTPWTPFRAERR